MSGQPPPHRVLRLLVELQTPSAADAAALQDAVQRLLHAHWLPLIEQACNSQGHPDLVQRIDRLALDLGNVPAQALLAAASQASAAGDVHGPGHGHGRAHGSPVPQQGRSQAVNQAFSQCLGQALGQALQTADVVQTDLELVAFFLHTGALPWWADAADRHAVQRAALALLQGPPLDPAQVREIGLLIADKREGPFTLLVDWIAVE